MASPLISELSFYTGGVTPRKITLHGGPRDGETVVISPGTLEWAQPLRVYYGIPVPLKTSHINEPVESMALRTAIYLPVRKVRGNSEWLEYHWESPQ